MDNGGNGGAKSILPAATWSFTNVTGQGLARLEITSSTVVNVVAPVLTVGTNFELTVLGQVLCSSQPTGAFVRAEAMNGGQLILGSGGHIQCTEFSASDGGTFTLNATNALFCVQAEALSGGTLLLNRAVSFTGLHVATNGLVSYSPGESNLVLTVSSNLVVDVGGRISVDGKGFPGTDGAGAGPGGGEGQKGVGWVGGGGGGYGGAGGASSSGHAGGGSYGSLAEAIHWGSAGGAASQGQGAAGGGAMRLKVTGALQVDGQITANGNDGVADSYGGPGGGSGGSIWITALMLAGNGSIAANGGAGGSTIRGTGGGGGGGRVAINAQTNLFLGTVTSLSGAGYQNGTNGTHYRFIKPPVMSGSMAGSGLKMVWPSESWVKYQILSASNLIDAPWVEEGPRITGTGGVLQTNLDVGKDPAKFYRLQVIEE